MEIQKKQFIYRGKSMEELKGLEECKIDFVKREVVED